MSSAEQTGSPRAVETRTWLRSHRAEIEQQRADWARRESRWSWARLVIFVGAVVAWFAWGTTPLIPGLLTVVAGLLFACAVRYHHRSRGQRELRDGMLVMLDEALRRCGGKLELIRCAERPADVEDEALDLPSVLTSGPTWPLTDQERDDLDVLAEPIGLFGLLNRASNVLGARRLRDMLDHPCLSAERIAAHQQAVRWLEEHAERRVRLMGTAARLRGEDQRLTGFVRAVHGARALTLFLPVPLLRIWSLVTALLASVAMGYILLGHFHWSWLLAGVLAANGLILRRIGKTLTAALAPWWDVASGVEGFLVAARQGAVDLPTEAELSKLRECFVAVVDPGYLPALCRRIGSAERGGGVHQALNHLALYDLHVAAGILKRAVPNREALLTGLAALADLEALASLACFAAEQPVICYPTLTGDHTLEISDGCHPLIAPERVVPNSVGLNSGSRVWIITGPNLAGKSTFLRMVGLNVLLAQLGSAVAAREMRWSPLRLMTDLQARDDLARDESYFLAEVRHLRRIVAPPAGDEILLGLIDEPFRGTNSQEQSAASVALLRYLLKSPNLVLLATHDRHLTELADGNAVKNFHYREDLTSDGLVFDYRLYEGPARTRNALRVLEREGYPAQVLEDAYEWLRESADRDS